MNQQNRSALAALAAAGVIWGLNVPLSKLALAWLAPGWVAAIRFAVALPLLALLGRGRLRQTCSARVLASGAVGFGLVIVLQNAGIQRTSVSHAAVLLGAVPVLVALIAAGADRSMARPRTWGGYGLALVGVTLVAGAQASGTSATGDGLVLASAALSAACIVIQPRLLAGRDPAAVTAIQFAGGLIVAVPATLLVPGSPGPSAGAEAPLALLLLALGGTALPFWLFAYGQARVPAQLAGTFLNLEPLVGACVGWLALGEAAAATQLSGAVAVLAGVLLSALPDRCAPPALACAPSDEARSFDFRSPRARGDIRGRVPWSRRPG